MKSLVRAILVMVLVTTLLALVVTVFLFFGQGWQRSRSSNYVLNNKELASTTKKANDGDTESIMSMILHYSEIGNKDEEEKWINKGIEIDDPFVMGMIASDLHTKAIVEGRSGNLNKKRELLSQALVIEKRQQAKDETTRSGLVFDSESIERELRDTEREISKKETPLPGPKQE